MNTIAEYETALKSLWEDVRCLGSERERLTKEARELLEANLAYEAENEALRYALVAMHKASQVAK